MCPVRSMVPRHLTVAREGGTGFTNTEEQAAGRTQIVPFLIEDMLKRTVVTTPRWPTGSPMSSPMAC